METLSRNFIENITPRHYLIHNTNTNMKLIIII